MTAIVLMVALSAPVFATDRAEGKIGGVTIYAGPEFMSLGEIKIPGGSMDIDSQTGFNLGAIFNFGGMLGLEICWSHTSFDEGSLDPQPMVAVYTYDYYYGYLVDIVPLEIDVNINYLSAGPTFKILGDKATITIGAGLYLCKLNMEISLSDYGLSESDSDSTVGVYTKLNAAIPISGSFGIGASVGYRAGGDVTVFDDVGVETGGLYTSLNLQWVF